MVTSARKNAYFKRVFNLPLITVSKRNGKIKSARIWEDSSRLRLISSFKEINKHGTGDVSTEDLWKEQHSLWEKWQDGELYG